MRIIPAIDIIGGKCVRLTQGDYGQMKVYREDPLEVAEEFEQADLEYLHLIDLDGAKKGKVVNWKVIEEIQEKTALKIDFGGGIKTDSEVSQLLELGVNQLNIGSIAVKKPDVLIQWIKTYGAENFILSADVQDDNVFINGWLESSDLRLFDLVDQFEKAGLQYMACTDIRFDGMLEGPNFKLYEKLKTRFPDLKIIASGGVSSVEDLKQLKLIGVEAAIVGKAIYEGKIQLSDLKTV
jgi:phosphoribosylformimino-5-aminoimidazole carboxamide ribotide isomerase